MLFNKGVNMNQETKTYETLSLLHAIHYSYIDPGMDNGTTALASAFVKLQKILNPKASLEIGAHDADFSLKLRKIFPNIDIIAYEGSKTVYSAIAKRIDFESFNIQYCHGVVSDTDGTVVFREMFDEKTGEPAISFVSSLLPREDMTFLADNGYIEKDVFVSSIRGDSRLAKYSNDANICIWVDAEGANREILHGLEGALRAGKIGSLFIEVEQNALWKNQWLDRDVYAYMTGFGYFLLARDCQHYSQYNMLFVRNELLNNQLFGIISQEYSALNRISELRTRGSDFRCALSVAKGESFCIGENSYILSKSPDPRVLDLYSTSLPASCSYSVVFTGMHSIDIRLGILIPGIAFEDSELCIFDDDCVLAKLEASLLEHCSISSYEIKIGQRNEHGFLGITLAYSALKFDYYLAILLAFVEITSEFLRKNRSSV